MAEISASDLTSLTHKSNEPQYGAWIPAFLRTLRNTANVRLSCNAAGVSRAGAYAMRATNDDFRAAWETALQDACDILEWVAWKRALSSSDLLTIFLLKAHRPEKYRETLKLQGDPEKPIHVHHSGRSAT